VISLDVCLDRARRALIVLASEVIVEGEDGRDLWVLRRGEDCVSSENLRGIAMSAGLSLRRFFGGESVSVGDGSPTGPTERGVSRIESVLMVEVFQLIWRLKNSSAPMDSRLFPLGMEYFA
jgi:hypothetical protein